METMNMKYPVVVHKDENSDYGVIVPDIPGCISAGSSYEDALQNVVEAISCHLEGLLLSEEALPAGSDIDAWVDDKAFSGGVWALIDVDLAQLSGKVKRINITIPEHVLNLIDLYSKSHAIKNRSAFLANAALNYISRHR